MTEGIAKFRVATSVIQLLLSQINETRLSLSTIKRPKICFYATNDGSLYVLLCKISTE